MASFYFSHLPDIQYRNPLDTSNTSINYVTAKNLFTRAQIRDDIKNSVTYLKKYTITEGERPQDVAAKIYGSLEYDWIVLVTANITNVKTQWPMSNKVLYDYCVDKYGLDDLNATAFYETTEVKDANGKLFLPKGLKVDSNFTIRDPNNNTLTINPVLGISNYLVETRENERKRNIEILKPFYLTQFMMDMRDSLKYTQSSQYINRNTKMTFNSEIQGR